MGSLEFATEVPEGYETVDVAKTVITTDSASGEQQFLILWRNDDDGHRHGEPDLAGGACEKLPKDSEDSSVTAIQETPLAGARREMREELGPKWDLGAAAMELINERPVVDDKKKILFVHHIYHADVADPPERELTEHYADAWLPVDEAQKLFPKGSVKYDSIAKVRRKTGGDEETLALAS
jgi:ADP-ribose pyrophosphatase YjhB (NUDIX family)